MLTNHIRNAIELILIQPNSGEGKGSFFDSLSIRIPYSTHRHNKIREVGFRVLGRDFRLILSPKKGLLHPNFKAVEVIEEDEVEESTTTTSGDSSSKR